MPLWPRASTASAHSQRFDPKPSPIPSAGPALQAREPSRRRRKRGLAHGVLLGMQPGVLLKRLPIVAELVGDAVLEGVIGLGLDEEVADGVEDGGDLGGGLPLVGLEDGEADVAEGVIRDVGVVDAGGEAELRGLEGVVGGEGEEEGEAARVVGRGGGRGEDDVPGVEGLRGGEGDGEVGGRGLGCFGEFLDVERRLAWHDGMREGGRWEGGRSDGGAYLGDALGRHVGGGWAAVCLAALQESYVGRSGVKPQEFVMVALLVLRGARARRRVQPCDDSSGSKPETLYTRVQLEGWANDRREGERDSGSDPGVCERQVGTWNEMR